MPKKIDHAERRLELAEALWRLTRRDGWEAISLRKVAAEAGVSMGMVQHYFTSKDEMLLFALNMITEDTRDRIRRRVAELPEPHTPRSLVEAVLAEMLPQPDRRQSEVEAASVFVRRFLLRPESAEQLAASNPDLPAFLAEQIRTHRCAEATATEKVSGNLRTAGQPTIGNSPAEGSLSRRQGSDPAQVPIDASFEPWRRDRDASSQTGTEAASAERDARGLIALLDGLMLNITTGTLNAETAFRILETQLDYLFGRSNRIEK